jgi:hypothetical protein
VRGVEQRAMNGLDHLYDVPAILAVSNTVMPDASALLVALGAHLYLPWIHPFGDGNGELHD